MKRLLAAIILVFSGSPAFSDESLLVEAARRATAYWDSRFARCDGRQGGAVAWYAVIPNGLEAGSIQMVPELNIEFRTEQLTPEEKLNGVQIKATTSLSSGAFRWWIAKNKTWREWQVDEIAPPAIVIRKNGVWSVQIAPNRYEDREALTICSQIPPLVTARR